MVLLWLFHIDLLVVLDLPQFAEPFKVHPFLEFGLEDVVGLEDFLRFLKVGLLLDGGGDEEVVEHGEGLGASVEVH